jgi:hypothetical protein
MTISHSRGLAGGIALMLAAAASVVAITAATAQTQSKPVVRDHRPGTWQPKPRGAYRPGYNKHGEKPVVRDHRQEAWQPKCGRHACDRPRPRH